jgi:putative spermidine/putrescine transport system substrate-binding protein
MDQRNHCNVQDGELLADATSEVNSSRRRVLKAAAAGLVLSTSAGLARLASAQTKTLNFASYGGSYGDALRKAWLDPFERETGIKVNLGVNASLSLAKLQTMNPNGAEWDIVDLTGPEFSIATKQGMLSPMDPKTVDTSKLLPEYVKSHGFGYAAYVWGMAWDRSKISDANAPKSWADFWNTKLYPGKRSLITVNTNGYSIEAALQADGVPTSKLYPIDAERAFKSLDKLGRQNIVWATSNQEPIQRLTSGECALAGMYVGRAIMANRGGANIGFTLNGAGVAGDFLGVIQNARNKPEAFALLNYIATHPERAAEFTAITSYPVPIKGIDALIPASASDVKAVLPSTPAVRAKIYSQSDDYWANNLPQIAAAFKAWQLS